MDKGIVGIIDELAKEHILTEEKLQKLLLWQKKEEIEYLFECARAERERWYGKDVYIRGLIEFTNYCRNDCYYCGLRRSNSKAERYRLKYEEIIDCCRCGYDLGYRTFVLQGGEDYGYTKDMITELVSGIRRAYKDCAITLSFGEWEREAYEEWYMAGANRYLLRHETADCEHYSMLHPPQMSYENRMRCLKDLKEIGYQVGAGFMVGSPYQTTKHLVKDLMFLKKFSPHMVGIGPFISQKDTPFAEENNGALELTLKLLAILRLLLPKVLLPATTALGTIAPNGRQLGILAGANVVMPNLSPINVRKKYAIYDNKISSGEEAAEGKVRLEEQMESIGYKVVVDVGNSKMED